MVYPLPRPPPCGGGRWDPYAFLMFALTSLRFTYVLFILFLCCSIQIVQIVDKSHFPAVITHVSAGKQAAIAGVLPGMHIHAVNGKECRDKPLKWVVAMIKQKKSSGV